MVKIIFATILSIFSLSSFAQVNSQMPSNNSGVNYYSYTTTSVTMMLPANYNSTQYYNGSGRVYPTAVNIPSNLQTGIYRYQQYSTTPGVVSGVTPVSPTNLNQQYTPNQIR